MTNEELAIKIKGGSTDLIADLWTQTEKIIRLKANHYFIQYQALCLRRGVSVEDLYQVGFFALLGAIEAYEPESEYVFNTYLKYPYMNEVRRLLGKKTSKKDALDSAKSFDAPAIVSFKDDEETLLLDLIPDLSAEEAYKNIIDEDYRISLKNALDKALASLPQKREAIVRARYYKGLNLQALAERFDLSNTSVSAILRRSLEALSRRSELKSMRDEIISRFEYTSGFITWKKTGMSPQERIVVKLEEKALL